LHPTTSAPAVGKDSLDRLLEWPAERALIGDVAVEPQLGQHDRRRFPHKQAWLDKHLGMIIFRLRPPERRRRQSLTNATARR
jgi:hypothetical protein